MSAALSPGARRKLRNPAGANSDEVTRAVRRTAAEGRPAWSHCWSQCWSNFREGLARAAIRAIIAIETYFYPYIDVHARPERPLNLADPASPTTVAVLYGDHHGWLKTWLQQRLGNAHDAADLAHDTFVRILGARSPGPIREPRAYLTTVARGLVIDHWRRRDIEVAFFETLAALPPVLVPSPEHRALALEALIRVDALLGEMKVKVREAFLLAQIDGLAYREIGERMGVGERMVKKYMAEAMLHCLRAEPAILPGQGV